MGRYALIFDAKKAEFTIRYIPKGINWRLIEEDVNPFSEQYKLGPNEYPVHISFFKEGGLRLPLWPLLVDFIRCTNLTLGQ